MFELTFFVPVLIVASIWGFFLLNFAGNNRRILDDDILSANEKQRKEAESRGTFRHLPGLGTWDDFQRTQGSDE